MKARVDTYEGEPAVWVTPENSDAAQHIDRSLSMSCPSCDALVRAFSLVVARPDGSLMEFEITMPHERPSGRVCPGDAR